MHIPADVIKSCIDIRHRIHSAPELSFQEKQTKTLLLEALEPLGFEISEQSGNPGFSALWPGLDRTASIALRTDMDALPIQETSGKGWASKVKNVMHACGHDGHAAILYGLAQMLVRNKKQYPLDIKLIFQPAEEKGCGAAAMIKEGVLKNPEVKAIFAMHAWPSIASGSASVHAGPMMASVDNFNIQIDGKGGHGAWPHRSLDPIPLAAHLITMAQSLLTRTVNPLEPVVLTFGQVIAGSAHNVIPNNCELKGTLRTHNDKVRRQLKAAFERMLKGVVQAHGMECDIRWSDECPATVNPPEMAELVQKSIVTALGEKNTIEEAPNMAGEDFSFFLNEIPGAYLWLGVGESQGGLHNSRFDFNDQSIETGIKIYLQILEDYFKTGL